MLFENREIDGNRNSRDQKEIEKTSHFPELRAQPSPDDISKINRRPTLRSKDVQPAAIIVIYGERRISGTSGENQGLGNAGGWRPATSTLSQRTDTPKVNVLSRTIGNDPMLFATLVYAFLPENISHFLPLSQGREDIDGASKCNAFHDRLCAIILFRIS